MEELKEVFSWRVISCYYLLFLSFRGGVYSNYFFFSFLNNFLDPTHKRSAPPSQAQWQRANRAFTWTPVGLNPQPFFQVQVPRRAIPLSHHPRGVLTSNNLGCNMDTSPRILFQNYSYQPGPAIGFKTDFGWYEADIYTRCWNQYITGARLILPQVPIRLVSVEDWYCVKTYQTGRVLWNQCIDQTAYLPCTALCTMRPTSSMPQWWIEPTTIFESSNES